MCFCFFPFKYPEPDPISFLKLLLLLSLSLSHRLDCCNLHHMKLQSHTHQSVMATSRSHPHSLKVAVTVVFIFSLTFLPPKSAGSLLSTSREIKGSKFPGNGENYVEGEKKTVLGSRPPGCENKCLNCRPCMATLVVPVHRNRMKRFKASPTSHDEDDSYYLLSWKCRCGNKIYQP